MCGMGALAALDETFDWDRVEFRSLLLGDGLPGLVAGGFSDLEALGDERQDGSMEHYWKWFETAVELGSGNRLAGQGRALEQAGEQGCGHQG